MDLQTTVATVAKEAAQKIYGPRKLQLGKPNVVFYTLSEAEILIKETIHVELKKLGLVE